MFFQFMPTVDYDFGNRDIKEVENIVIAVNPVDDIYSNRYFDNKIIGDETPEAISESLYRDPAYYWNILYVNRVVNPFTEWVKTSEELEEAMREHGIEYYKDVKLAMFEIDGNISIISGNENLKQTHHKRKIHKTLGELNN